MNPGRSTLRLGTLAALLLGCATLGASASSGDASDEATIWQNEQAIYAGRSGGSLSFYVEHADPDYAGWPPTVPAPMGYAELAASSKNMAGQSGETLTMEKKLIRIHRNGNIALAFYTTHRTHVAGGAAVDQNFENIHVWVKDPDGWRILGGMARPVPVRTAPTH